MVRQRGHGPCHRGREPLQRSDQAGARRARSDRAGPGPAPEERRAAHGARMVGGARARPRGSLRACPAGRSDGTARPEDRARDVRHAHVAGDPALSSAARPRSCPAARQDCRGARLMRVAISLRVANDGWDEASRYVVEAERTSRIQLGSGIMQAGTRTPALVAMTAMSLAAMSGGRFLLGLGVSGPQVIEGWHGIRFDRPLQRMRETIDIVRQATRGERVSYKGRVYELPLPGGEGKALRSAAKPQPNIPIYLATLSPKSLEMTGEIADGWLGTSFMPEHARVFFDHLEAGARRAGRSLVQLDLQAGGFVAFSDDVERLIAPRKPGLAFTLGAMGSRQHNFYNDAYRRAGYADAAAEVQRLWLEGKRDDAAARVPDE